MRKKSMCTCWCRYSWLWHHPLPCESRWRRKSLVNQTMNCWCCHCPGPAPKMLLPSRRGVAAGWVWANCLRSSPEHCCRYLPCLSKQHAHHIHIIIMCVHCFWCEAISVHGTFLDTNYAPYQTYYIQNMTQAKSQHCQSWKRGGSDSVKSVFCVQNIDITAKRVYRCVSSSAGQVSPSSVGCIHNVHPAPADWALWPPA